MTQWRGYDSMGKNPAHNKIKCLRCHQKSAVSFVEEYCIECLLEVLQERLRYRRCRRDTIKWAIMRLKTIFLERPKLQSLFSELIGHMLGDGSFGLVDYYDEKYKMKRHYYLVRYTPSSNDPEDARHFVDLHRILFGFEPKTYPKSSVIEVRSKHKVGHIIHCFLPPGRKTITNPKIPPFIYNSDDNMIGCLKAIFKDDGYLYLYKGTEDINLKIDMNICISEKVKEELTTLLDINHRQNSERQTYIYKHQLPLRIIKEIETNNRCNVLDDISEILTHLGVSHTLNFLRININKQSITATWVLSVDTTEDVRKLQKLGIIDLDKMKVNIIKTPTLKMGIRKVGTKIPGARIQVSNDVNDLFEKARNKFRSWRSLAIALKIHPKMLYRYRKGISTIPVVVYDELKRLATT